jgi:SH3-like domain-containing protein
MYRHGRVTLIAAACAVALGAMLLIPGSEDAVVADVPPTVATIDSSQETIAAIDAMLGTDEVAEAAPAEAVAKRTITDADRNLMTAALTAPKTDLEGAPLLDPNLRPDSIGPSAVNLRAGPSSATATIAVLQPGQPVRTGESDGGWVEVTLPDGSTGWVFSRYLASTAKLAALEPTDSNDKASAKSDVSSRSSKALVNARGNLEGRTARIDATLVVRAKPGNGAPALFRTEPGERVRIVDVRGKWLRIVTADGSTGWIERG